MSETGAWIFAMTVLVLAHLAMYLTYAAVWGRPLKLRYSWAAHGLLLMGKRARDWEVNR